MVKRFNGAFRDKSLNDVARIRTVVESLRPGEILRADANTGRRRDETLQEGAGTGRRNTTWRSSIAV